MVKKHGGTLPEAKVETIDIKPARIEYNRKGQLTTFKKNYTTIPEETIKIRDVTNIPEADFKDYEGDVIGTTYKEPEPPLPPVPPKSMTQKAIRKVGKMTGLIPRIPKDTTVPERISDETVLGELDFDTNILEGTCLEGKALTLNDIEALNDFSKQLSKSMGPIDSSEFVKRKLIEALPLYCKAREKMFIKDTAFNENYSNFYYTTLIYALFNDTKKVNELLAKVKSYSPAELNIYNFTSNDMKRPQNGLHYTEGRLLPPPVNEPLPKNIGGKHKTKKNKSKKSKTRKSKSKKSKTRKSKTTKSKSKKSKSRK
jgi:hypothetical protein